MNSDVPRVTVVVVPREGFAAAPACLDVLIARTPPGDWRLVYVDAGSPEGVAAQLQKRVLAAGGTLIRSPHFLRPSAARELGLAEVTTPFVVFLDNDVTVSEGWLELLLAAAEASGAAYVSPLITSGPAQPPIVHVAGGRNAMEVDPMGRRRLVEEYAHAGRALSEVSPAPGPTSMAEFHCVLVRMSALESAGGLDPRLTTAFEHNHLCLSLEPFGGGWLEPRAVVDYAHSNGSDANDRDFHLLRWSRPWIEESLDALCERYALSPNDPAVARDLGSLHSRRRAPYARSRRRIRAIAGRRALRLFDALLDRYIDWRLVRPAERSPAQIEIHRPPTP